MQECYQKEKHSVVTTQHNTDQRVISRSHSLSSSSSSPSSSSYTMVQYNDGSDFLTMITRRSCCAWVVRVLASPSVVRLCILVEPSINKQPPQKKFENCIRKITNQQMVSYIMVVLSCCLSVSKPLLNPPAQMTKYQEASITTKECLGRSLPAVALAWNMPCKPAQQSQVCVCV